MNKIRSMSVSVVVSSHFVKVLNNGGVLDFGIDGFLSTRMLLNNLKFESMILEIDKYLEYVILKYGILSIVVRVSDNCLSVVVECSLLCDGDLVDVRMFV